MLLNYNKHKLGDVPTMYKYVDVDGMPKLRKQSKGRLRLHADI